MQSPTLTEHRISMNVGLASNHRQQGSPKVRVKWPDTCNRFDSCRKIDQFDQRITDTRPDGVAGLQFYQKRHIGQAVFKCVLRFLDEAIIAGKVAVIGEEKYSGLIVD